MPHEAPAYKGRERPLTSIEQGENSIGKLVRAYSKLSTFKKLALAAALAGTEYGYLKTMEHFAPDAFKAPENQVPDQQVEALLDGHEPTVVDERFESQGVRPLVVRQGLDRMFGREFISENIRQIQYSPDHIRMPNHYHGSSPFEAGHCTRSPLPGARSTIVLTVDTFQRSIPSSTTPETSTVTSERGASAPRDAEEIGAVLIHEVAHALSAESAEGMPPEIRARLNQALHAIVAGHNQSVYVYVNNYDRHGEASIGSEPHHAETPASSAEIEQEDSVQQEELFAEMISDAGRWEPLPAASPLRVRPIDEQMTSRFALNHDLTLEQARPYGAVYAVVADWRGNAFFDQMQMGYQGMRQEIRQDILHDAAERSARRMQTALEGLVFPSLSVGLQRWVDTGQMTQEEIDERSSYDAVEKIYDLEEDLINEGSGNPRVYREGLALSKPLYARAKNMADRLRADHVAYNTGFVARLGHPQLISLFEDVTHQLQMARNHIRLANVPASNATATTGEAVAVVEADVAMINQKLALLDGIEGLTSPQRAQFHQALLQWMEGERSERWYAGLADRIPDLDGLYSDIVSEQSEQGEREGVNY